MADEQEVRRRLLEEAAQVADALHCDEPDICSDPVHQTARAIAARIRALIDRPRVEETYFPAHHTSATRIADAIRALADKEPSRD